MFYSHEILTDRKYGVATVWLVATLGSKSQLKKVSRKAILDVDVAKACERIVEPDAPMALRLQSSLLCGVARVYAQQCGYVLHDAESARNSMRAMLNVMRQVDLEPEGASKAKPGQLMLQDDPNFLPELDLMPLDFDNLNVDPPANETQDQISLRSSQLADGSQMSIGGLNIPPSQSSFIGGPVGGLDLFSGRGGSGTGTRVGPQLLEDDLGLVIDADGTMREDDVPSRKSRGLTPIGSRVNLGDYTRDGLVRYSEIPLGIGASDANDGFMPMQDDTNFGFGGDMQDGAPAESHQETTSETAVAPMKRKARNKPPMPVDDNLSLNNRDLTRMQKNYLENMRQALQAKQSAKLNAIARENAKYWVLGAGNLLGQGMRGPLDIFSGARLIEAFTGINLLTGQKRQRDEDDSSDSDRRVRSRIDTASDEVGRGLQDDGFQAGFQDDGYMPIENDDTIEQGREAPTPLDDRQLSSILPWNQSAGSRQLADAHPTSASYGAPQLNILGRRGSRLTSASPLVGRGALDDLNFPGSDIEMSGLNGEEEFELFGPAAQVDTQTAAQSQWQRTALGTESQNFLAFVDAAIEEADQRRKDAGAKPDAKVDGSVDFETILPPESNSQIVAAQAFLHVLTLGTKRMLEVEQKEPFEAIKIRMGMVAAA